MAANNIVIGSEFKPFSYAELLHPVQLATEAHQELENKYSELSAKAGIWDQIADEQTDPYAYKMYKTYSDDLRQQADLLASEGLAPSSRQSLLDLRNRYSQEIVPIEQAYTRRRQLSDEQRNLRAKDGTIMFNNENIGLTSLDDFIRNPELSYESESGAVLVKQTSEAAKNLIRTMRDNPREWRSILGGQYYESRIKTGYSPEEVLAAINNLPNAPKELRAIMDNIYEGSRVRNWSNEDATNRAYRYIATGIWDALGETKYQNVANRGYIDPQQRKSSNRDNSSEARLPYRRVNRVSVNSDVDTRGLSEDLDFVREVKKDMEGVLGEQATRTERPMTPSFGGVPMIGVPHFSIPYGKKRDTTFYPNTDRFNRLIEKYGTNDIDELQKRISDNIASSAIKQTQYALNYTDSKPVSEVIEENLLAAASPSEVVPAFKYKDGRKKDQLTLDDIEEVDFSKGKLRYDPSSGLLYDYVDSKDRRKTMLIDPGALDTPEGTLSAVQEDINHAIELKDYNMVAKLSDFYLKTLDGIINSRAKVQGKTDSNLEIEYPTFTTTNE